MQKVNLETLCSFGNSKWIYQNMSTGTDTYSFYNYLIRRDMTMPPILCLNLKFRIIEIQKILEIKIKFRF